MSLNPPIAALETLEQRCLFAAVPIGEAASLTFAQPDANTWQTVTLGRTYTDPIVVASLGTTNDVEPAEVRVRNVTSTGFEIQIDEWDYLDGVHGSETVHYVVVESGRHELDTGTTIVAGRTASDGSVTGVVYTGGTLTDPAVFAQVATVNGTRALTTRLEVSGSAGFDVRIDDEPSYTGGLVTEAVDWIAIERGAGVSLDTRYDVQSTPNVVTDDPYSVAWSSPFDAPPVVIAESQTRDGSDEGHVRLIDRTTTGTNLFFEEEQSTDTETDHTDEVVGVWAIDAGTLSFFVNDDPVATDDTYELDEGGTLTVAPALGVLANDSDVDPQTLSASLVTPPVVGSLSLDTDGGFVYTPPFDFYGSVAFDYQVDDGAGGTDVATASIHVLRIDVFPWWPRAAASFEKLQTAAEPTAGAFAGEGNPLASVEGGRVGSASASSEMSVASRGPDRIPLALGSSAPMQSLAASAGVFVYWLEQAGGNGPLAEPVLTNVDPWDESGSGWGEFNGPALPPQPETPTTPVVPEPLPPRDDGEPVSRIGDSPWGSALPGVWHGLTTERTIAGRPQAPQSAGSVGSLAVGAALIPWALAPLAAVGTRKKAA
ncbi:MAG: cadherin-like domain-containing protein [Planctomycetota bacterium]